MKTRDFLVRDATLDDIDALAALNRMWLAIGLDSHSRADGFLFGEAYAHRDFAAIVEAGEIVVADVAGQVAGYYLLDNVTDSPTSRSYERYLATLAKNGTIPVSAARTASWRERSAGRIVMADGGHDEQMAEAGCAMAGQRRDGRDVQRA